MPLRMHNGIVRKLRGVRYILKMIRSLISLRRLEKIGYTINTQSDGSLKGGKWVLGALEGSDGQQWPCVAKEWRFASY